MSFPACFESAEDFDVYQMYATQSDRFTGFCMDCNPEYQREMALEGKCERPQVRFFLHMPKSPHRTLIGMVRSPVWTSMRAVTLRGYRELGGTVIGLGRLGGIQQGRQDALRAG